MLTRDARAVLARVLDELGGEPALLDALDGDALDDLARGLVLPRHVARVVQVDAGSLGALALPALVRTDAGIAIVRAVGRRRVKLEHASGTLHDIARATLVAHCRGRALVLVPTLPRAGGFVAAMLAFLAGERRDLAQLVSLLVVQAALGLALPHAAELATDRALPERAPKLLALLALGTLAIALQRALLRWLEQEVALALAARLELATDTRLVEQLMHAPFAEVRREGVGDWLETLRGAAKVRDALADAWLGRALDLCLVLVFGLALAHTRSGLALALMLATCALALVALAFGLRERGHERALTEASARQSEALEALIAGVPTWRSAGAEKRGVARWLERLLVARVGELRHEREAALARALIGGMRDAIGVGTLVFAAHAALAGTLSVGALLSVLLLADRFVGAGASLADSLGPLLSARVHLARVDALRALPATAGRLRGAPRMGSSDAAVVLRDVWFRYAPDQPWILEGYSLHVPRGARITLTGASGSGKSTILRLIAGLHVPERGSVRVFGRDPCLGLADMAYLPQQPFLFSGSIRDNLALLSGAREEALHAAAEASGLDAFVRALPMGYETVLPPGGSTLSGGQRQLIAWTAALASGRSLLLLDEALSQVDRITRARLVGMLADVPRTSVSVAHDADQLAG